jgi:hypothetical protein
MRSNQIKAHWRLEDLGWMLYPPGDPAQWDGLLSICANLRDKWLKNM